MLGAKRGHRWAGITVLGSVLLGGPGCFHTHPSMVGPDPAAGVAQPTPPPISVPPDGAVPRELSKITLPPYVIEAPDNLLIEVVRVGKFPVPDPKDETGVKNLIDPETKKDILRTGSQRLPIQAISGPFQVRIDGTVGLGFWGSVTVAGLSLEQAQQAIKEHLLRSDTLGPKGLGATPETLVVIVDVLAYNSKRYYVILDGGGYGEQVYPFPITGSETVLDAVSNVNGLHAVASKRNIWVARRCPHPDQPMQILPVDWIGISQHGYTTTNYQILPGDRIYVKAQGIVTFDTALARVISPIERLFGVTLLGVNTVNQFKTSATTSSGQ